MFKTTCQSFESSSKHLHAGTNHWEVVTEMMPKITSKCKLAVPMLSKMHCAESHVPFECLQMKLQAWKRSETDATFERGSAQDRSVQCSLN